MSQRQKTVATSSTHAEYVTASEATKEAYWVRGFLNELSVLEPYLRQEPIPLHIDNSSAVKLSKNPESHARTRYIDIRHHYIREQVEERHIQPIWISGKTNPADLFTKALPAPTLDNLTSKLGLRNCVPARLGSSADASEPRGDI